MMNRDEMLKRVSKWGRWPIVPTGGLPKEPGGWDWIVVDGIYVLTHSIHDPITRADWQDARTGCPVAATPTANPVPVSQQNKYQRTVPSTTIDVYDVLTAYNVTNPATQHAIKKLLQPGNRGHKDTLTDLREALASIQRAIQIEEQSLRG